MDRAGGSVCSYAAAQWWWTKCVFCYLVPGHFQFGFSPQALLKEQPVKQTVFPDQEDGRWQLLSLSHTGFVLIMNMLSLEEQHHLTEPCAHHSTAHVGRFLSALLSCAWLLMKWLHPALFSLGMVTVFLRLLEADCGILKTACRCCGRDSIDTVGEILSSKCSLSPTWPMVVQWQIPLPLKFAIQHVGEMLAK